MKADLQLNFIGIVRGNWPRRRLALTRFTFFLFNTICITATVSWEIDILILTARTKTNLFAFTRIVGDAAALTIPPCLARTRTTNARGVLIAFKVFGASKNGYLLEKTLENYQERQNMQSNSEKHIDLEQTTGNRITRNKCVGDLALVILHVLELLRPSPRLARSSRGKPAGNDSLDLTRVSRYVKCAQLDKGLRKKCGNGE